MRRSSTETLANFIFVADEKLKSEKSKLEILKGLIDDGATTLENVLKSPRYPEELK
ncbi:MAG: hypothetical protein H6492_01895 [Candidatus Paracaedibacteraceae bacterium]|nr:hypothetical protein [Candidatus Paracaedibacteraceae bacterium]